MKTNSNLPLLLLAAVGTGLLISSNSKDSSNDLSNGVKVATGGGLSAAAFFKKYYPFAKQSEASTKVPALVTLAQAAIESGYGKHAPGNNFFGIKSSPDWKGKTQQLKDNIENKMSTFRAYNTPLESFLDHGIFLMKNKRYAHAFKTTTPASFAQSIANEGYSTSPTYGSVIVDTINKAAQALS